MSETRRATVETFCCSGRREVGDVVWIWCGVEVVCELMAIEMFLEVVEKKGEATSHNVA